MENQLPIVIHSGVKLQLYGYRVEMCLEDLLNLMIGTNKSCQQTFNLN